MVGVLGGPPQKSGWVDFGLGGNIHPLGVTDLQCRPLLQVLKKKNLTSGPTPPAVGPVASHTPK